MINSNDIYEEKEVKSRIARILLVDDHPLLRFALKEILQKQSDFEVVAEASDGNEAVTLANKLSPDVIIMDIDMPTLDGIEATRQIMAKHPKTAILVLTVYDDSEHVMNILEAGAVGYLTKRAFAKEIIHAIHAALAGDTVLSPSVSKEVIKYALRYTNKPISINSTERLSVKEIEVMRLAAKGFSNKEIAIELSISERMVKNYFSQIFLILGVTSRTEAAILCVRKGILSMDDIS
jgi:NarL family two-component system response regulator LiaR